MLFISSSVSGRKMTFSMVLVAPVCDLSTFCCGPRAQFRPPVSDSRSVVVSCKSGATATAGGRLTFVFVLPPARPLTKSVGFGFEGSFPGPESDPGVTPLTFQRDAPVFFGG